MKAKKKAKKYIPLFQLAKDDRLGKIQMMDLEALNWMGRKFKDERITIHKLFPYYNAYDVSYIRNFVPSKIFFLKKKHYSSIHGVRHTLRVLLYTGLLSQSERGDIDSLLMAASVHDLRRRNDKKDEGHGLRAARWFLANIHFFKKSAGLNHEQIESVYNSVAYHDVPLETIPYQIQKKYLRLIKILKTADALDRFRLPLEKWWPKMEFIYVGNARKLLTISKCLIYRSEKLFLKNQKSDVEAVFEPAIELGFIKNK